MINIICKFFQSYIYNDVRDYDVMNFLFPMYKKCLHVVIILRENTLKFS